jgi:hypothetical protein
MSERAPASLGGAQRATPIARFLGEQEAAGGPFALLNLPPAMLTDDQIIGALDAQLGRLGAHVEGSTPQADEVRLALHAAAAQLLDPRVRSHLLARWGESPLAPHPASDPGAPPEAAPEATRSAHVALEHDAVLTLGQFGGWNDRSLGRLMALAAARGQGRAELADALRGLGGRVHQALPATPSRVARSGPAISRLGPGRLPATPAAAPLDAEPGPSADERPLPEQTDPAARTIKLALLGGAVGLLTLIVAFGIIALATRAPAPTVVPAAPVIAAPAPADPAPPTAAAPEPPPAEGAPDIEVVSRELARAVTGLEADPEGALIRFSLAIAALSDGWPSLPPDEMVAAQHQVIEFLYRAGPGVADRAIEAVGAGAAVLGVPGPIAADRIRPAIWSAGMLSRLSREHDLPSGLEELVDSRLNAALGQRRPVIDPTFESGAAAAIQVIPSLLVAPPAAPEVGVPAVDPSRVAGAALDAWRRWMDAASRVPRQIAPGDRLVLGGLQTLLIEGPDPSVDQVAFKVVRMVVSQLTWRPGDESRGWLLRWFDDRRITSTDLYAVTSALATGSSAEGVDATMVVPVLASDRVRVEMRDSYAQAWGLADGADRGEIIDELVEAAADVLSGNDPGRSLPEILGSAVMLSRLSEAAAWAWRGQVDQTEILLAGFEDDVVLAAPSKGANPDIALLAPQSLSRRTSPWGERYLAAKKSIPLRLDLIGGLTSVELDAVSAEVLASDALRGTPYEVRKRASGKVLELGDSPLIVNAVLEELPGMPRVAANVALVERVASRQLPGPASSAWMTEARRALVERLLELVAAEGDLAQIDDESELLARSLEGRIRETPIPDSLGALSPPPPADASASLMYRQWQARVDPAIPPPIGPPSLEEIERRRTGRAALARGPVQAFAAQQISVCELMAYVVAAERAAEAPRITAILDELMLGRQRARHIFEQIRATEDAMLRLWLIRLGQEPPA